MNYIEKVREEAGASSDPIEKMLIDHLTWANVTLARLHAKAANEKSPKLSQHYASLAIQWMAQIGKSAVVLQQYRLATAKLAALTRRGVEPAAAFSLVEADRVQSATGAAAGAPAAEPASRLCA